MRRAVALMGFVAVAIATVPFVVAPSTPTRANADGPATIVVPASDGYGFGDCLASGSSCGRVVADAWCEAHGYGTAIEFGRAKPEDLTATATPVSAGDIAADPAILVTCQSLPAK